MPLLFAPIHCHFVIPLYNVTVSLNKLQVNKYFFLSENHREFRSLQGEGIFSFPDVHTNSEPPQPPTEWVYGLCPSEKVAGCSF
jgi:hypothetical protein